VVHAGRGPSTALRTGTANENGAEHPFDKLRASSERSGGVFPATQSKDAGLLGDAPASFDSVRLLRLRGAPLRTTPDSAQDAYAGMFRPEDRRFWLG
jgi:hypothetical protein